MQVPISTLYALADSVRGNGYPEDKYTLEIIHNAANKSEGRGEQFAVRTNDDGLLLAFRVSGEILALEIAHVDEQHRRKGVLTDAVATLKEHMVGQGISAFAVTGVIARSMEQWCRRYGMRRLDGPERWGTIPHSPVDYLIDWREN